ncbi:hypothetical protein K8O68_07035 [Salipaludibacillus sp. CUR1]|uniref:hypothetical protein n=1 Tax=Salipaludibacillus sp. CUR1 TaxID=2820003 RepID=UPI001E5A660E|nr:hypothetical protein [Salipaludibacillus sp. CUR1]MCE7792178.1 hypothetical protein [Salipaludibacillus sp. CUR1]
MEWWQKDIIRFFEALFFLIIGFFLSGMILKNTYEHFGIEYIGNIWVNWFGLSYLLFVLYSLAVGLIMKKNKYFRQRLTSIIFWLCFIVAIYIVFIPFDKGYNPF